MAQHAGDQSSFLIGSNQDGSKQLFRKRDSSVASATTRDQTMLLMGGWNNHRRDKVEAVN